MYVFFSFDTYLLKTDKNKKNYFCLVCLEQEKDNSQAQLNMMIAVDICSQDEMEAYRKSYQSDIYTSGKIL